MKYLILLLSVISISSYSQQDPYFVSDGFTPFWNNPAATASKNTLSANTIYRNQWPALSWNIQNLAFNVEADVHIGGKSDYKNGLNIPLGINAIFEKNGPQRIQTINIPVAVPITLGNSKLAVGVSAGVKNMSVNWAYVTFGDPVPNQDGARFDLNAGLFWYGKRHYVGISGTNLTTPNFGGFQSARHYYLQAGYQFKVGQHAIYPMLNAAYVAGFQTVRTMAYFQFKEDVFSIGLGYNFRSSAAFGATVRIKKFKLAYYFEYFQSTLGNANGNAHEVRLSYSIPKKSTPIVATGNPPF